MIDEQETYAVQPGTDLPTKPITPPDLRQRIHAALAAAEHEGSPQKLQDHLNFYDGLMRKVQQARSVLELQLIFVYLNMPEDIVSTSQTITGFSSLVKEWELMHKTKIQKLRFPSARRQILETLGGIFITAIQKFKDLSKNERGES